MTTTGRADGNAARSELPKCPTGIEGLDEVTRGGVPAGRATLLCGGPGCGKTLLALEFLVRGAIEHGEPGVFMAFEESPRELADDQLLVRDHWLKPIDLRALSRFTASPHASP